MEKQTLHLLIFLYRRSLFVSDIKKIPLVSSEISGLWNAYMSESLTI